MENDKLIEQISQREDAIVDKVASRKMKSSPIIARIQRADELRKKTVKVEGLSKSRFCKLKIQENFELIQKALQFEYGENMELNLKANEIEIYSRWVEGVTLFDANKKEAAQKITEIARIRNRLRLWVRIFENLSFYHSKGIIHGNIKPQNILIRDRTTVDIKQTSESEFFERKEDVPHVILLDGGYLHFIPYHVENLEEQLSQSKSIIEKNYWFAPEARGLLEGSYRENSDIFSLAAIMAWDLGIISLKGSSVLNSLWQLFILPETNSFILGGEWHKWNTKHPVFETMKRLRTILMRALEPLPEKRLVNARDLAFEFMMMSNRLTESSEKSDNQNLNSLFTIIQPEINDKSFSKLFIKNFDIPEMLAEFALEKNKPDNNRFWIDCRNKTANKYSLIRSLNTGMSIINKNVFDFGVKSSFMKVPFSTLDNLCQSLLSHILYLNPLFLQEIKTLFFNLGSQIDSIFYVLPSLKKYGDVKSNYKKNIRNTLIQVRHEWLYNNIDKIFDKILSASKISVIIIDDLNRADSSSLPILINIFKRHSKLIKWVIGIRSEEESMEEETRKQINQLKLHDPSFSGLKDDRTKSHWISKLNNLTSQQARFLSTWAMVDLQINTDIIELLSNKVSNISEIFSDKYHEGKQYTTNQLEQQEDLIFEDPSPISEADAKQEDEDEEDRKKDPLHLAYEALNIAIKIGLVSENRDVLSGHLICYYWEHQFIWLSLSLLLNKEIKSKIYYILSEYMCNNIGEKTTLNEIVHISEYLARSDLSHCAYSAYAALLIASEELCDTTSAEFIIAKLQMLGESIEKECPEEASVLVPKIREHIADLSHSLGKVEQAEKYYQAVSWNILNQKRKTILAMKSFFPSQIKKKEKRTEEFLNLIQQGEITGLLSNLYQDPKLSYNSAIEAEIYKIQKRLTEQDSFSNNEEAKNVKVLLKSFINSSETTNATNAETMKSLLKIRPVRGTVIAQLLRSCIGWIDNNILFPQILRIVHFTIENNDGESTVHLLFSLLLCGERNITPKIRSLILETITDLSGRLGSDINMYEAILLKAWSSFFYDGNLLECKKNLDKINSSISGELPTTLRQCARKLQIFVEFELLPLESIQNHAANIQKYLKRMHEFELSDWGIGNTVFSLQQSHPTLKKIAGDELFIGNILEEKTDQIMLYTHYLFERGHAHAAAMVVQEAKEIQVRQWFSDPSSHIEYAPERFALKVIEYTILKNRVFGGSKRGKSVGGVLSSLIYTLNKIIERKKENPTKYWGEDRAVKENIRIEKASTQDTEKLHFLAQNAVRSHFHWTAYRLAHKARSDLIVVANEIKEIEVSLKSGVGKESQVIPVALQTLPELHLAKMDKRYEESAAYPEQGVAINYVLEFLHNFQYSVRKSEFTEKEMILLSELIRKSVPKDSDIIESTLAAALRASAKRLYLRQSDEEIQEAAAEEPAEQNDSSELKQAG